MVFVLYLNYCAYAIRLGDINWNILGSHGDEYITSGLLGCDTYGLVDEEQSFVGIYYSTFRANV